MRVDFFTGKLVNRFERVVESERSEILLDSKWKGFPSNRELDVRQNRIVVPQASDLWNTLKFRSIVVLLVIEDCKSIVLRV